MIHTVNGPIEKKDMGITLSHEHLAWEYLDSWQLYFEKAYDRERLKVLYENLLPIFEAFHALGCNSIVEASPPRGGQNLMLMQKLSKASGINIIANTGLPFKTHVYKVHQDFSENELAERWIRDFNEGLDTLNDIVIKPAQIKLLLGDAGDGSLTKIDKKILKAAIIASQGTGMPIHCHLLKASAALEAIDLLENNNFDFSKFLWAHAGHEGNLEVMDAIFSRGGWLGFDQIRRNDFEKYYTLIKEVLGRGYQNRILLSQDYDFYEEVVKSNNNHPCTDFFDKFLKHCEEKGISNKVIKEILTKNPGNFFNID